MPPIAPSPLMWTIRLKYYKCTIVVHANPLEPFDNVKTELLRALRETHPSGSLPTAAGSATIPSETTDVVLAKPVDIHDYQQGWRRLKTAADDDDTEMQDDDASATSKSSKKKNALQTYDTLKAAGLRDGAVLAFKFRGQEPRDDNEDEGLGLGEEEEDRFDVVIPSYEDSVGVTNEGDVGGFKNYEG